MQAHRIYRISVLAMFLSSLTALADHPHGSSTDRPDRSCTCPVAWPASARLAAQLHS